MNTTRQQTARRPRPTCSGTGQWAYSGRRSAEGPCPVCGKRVWIKADGTIGKHAAKAVTR